jgi:hypothetical protein
MKNKPAYIVCPKCKYEYLPAEVFYPDEILGHPENIIRDKQGKIEFFIGQPINLSEEFTCYNCNCQFTTEVEIQFNTKESSLAMFDDEHTTTVFTNRTSLKEE